MPQLNVAPSPSPVVAPPASASAAPTDASSPASAAGDVPSQPFAALLRHQVSQQASSSGQPADKSVPKAVAAADALEQADAAGQPPADAIAAIAQMLAGIVPPAAGQAAPQENLQTAAAKGKKPGADDSQDSVLLAAPSAAAAPAPAAPLQAAAAETPKPVAAQPLGVGPAENFAAEGLQNAASHAASTKEEGADFAALLNVPQDARSAAATQAAAHAAPAAESSAAHIQTPVGAPGWDNEVGEKLTWLVNKHETRADLVLNPPELGRIEVSISLKGDQASASFVSANPTVREAIENAVPRLREVLQDAGISLGQTQVGAESFQQSTANREKGDNSSRSGNAGATIAQPLTSGVSGTAAAQILRRGNGLVDTFA